VKNKMSGVNSEKEVRCNLPTEVYSRVVGYFRPVQNWNEGKKEEFKERKPYHPMYFTAPLENASTY